VLSAQLLRGPGLVAPNSMQTYVRDSPGPRPNPIPRSERKNVIGAEIALREMGEVDLLEALDYVALLAELRPDKAPRAAVRWHGGLRRRPLLTLFDSALALAALLALCRADREVLRLLRRLVRRVRPTVVPRP
jgi:hypothetical protein